MFLSLRRFLGVHYRPVIIMGISVHIIWGLGLLLSSSVVNVVVLAGFHKFLDLGFDRYSLGTMLLLFSMAAIIGTVFESKLPQRTSFVLVLPQYFLMIAAFFIDLQFIIEGESLTGQSINRILILVALWPIMVISIFHTWAVIERWIFITKDIVSGI